jgi:ABC-type bacteriocin/lantibiotic exporter with double-glycine peptidase domain
MLHRVALVLACWLASACVGAGYTGAARDLTPNVWEKESGWIAVERVPLMRQHGLYDCGPTALAMVLSYWYPAVPTERWTLADSDRRLSAGELRDQARARGLAAFVVEGTIEDIAHELRRKRPVIVGTVKPVGGGKGVSHYEVVVGLHPQTKRIATLDPAAGWRQNTFEEFVKEWAPSGRLLLVVLPKEAGTAMAQAAPSPSSGVGPSGARAAPAR